MGQKLLSLLRHLRRDHVCFNLYKKTSLLVELILPTVIYEQPGLDLQYLHKIPKTLVDGDVNILIWDFIQDI